LAGLLFFRNFSTSHDLLELQKKEEDPEYQTKTFQDKLNVTGASKTVQD